MSQTNDFFTTQETQDTQESMSGYGRKRKASSSSSRSVKRTRPGVTRVPRPMAPGTNANSCIVPLTVDRTFDLTADFARGFSFGCEYLTESAGAQIAIPGASELAAVFSLMRVHKVEVTILPAATGLDYNAQTLSSGVTNIPYVYEGVDYQSYAAPSLSVMQQNPSCRTHILNKPIRRTIYPRLEGNNGIVDVGSNAKNIFKRSNAGSAQLWYGWKCYIDMANQVWTYGSGRISFKIYYECMQSK